jgi:hypothetical protein
MEVNRCAQKPLKKSQKWFRDKFYHHTGNRSLERNRGNYFEINRAIDRGYAIPIFSQFPFFSFPVH